MVKLACEIVLICAVALIVLPGQTPELGRSIGRATQGISPGCQNIGQSISLEDDKGRTEIK